MQALERNVVQSPATYEAPLSGAFEDLESTPFTPESVAQYKRKKMRTVMEPIQCRPKLQEITPGVRAQTHLKHQEQVSHSASQLKLFNPAS